MAVSGGLTGLLNNGVPANDDRAWLSDWLKARMREIDVVLQRIGNAHFHLKGGRWNTCAGCQRRGATTGTPRC